MESPALNLHFLLHAAALVEERLRVRLGELDIHPRQARVLDMLGRIGAASQIDIARAFDVTPASMSTMTARLIAAGLITRETDPEQARSNILRLTAHGRSMLSDIQAAWRDIDQMIAERIGQKKAAALASLTRELRDSLGGKVPGISLKQIASKERNKS